MKKVITICFLALLLNGCADPQPQVKSVVNGHEYGFFGGLWHGFVSPISLIGMAFSDDIDMYAINNSGFWYAFGFALGAGILTVGASKSRD